MDETLKCPHCTVTVSFAWRDTKIFESSRMDDAFHLLAGACPACKLQVIFLVRGTYSFDDSSVGWQFAAVEKRLVHPSSVARRAVPPSVPVAVAVDYHEACRVLTSSAKASAALSRRVLQAVLREKGYSQNDLAKQIDAVLAEAVAERILPVHLRDTIDAIRNFGNFSAHPVSNETTLQVIEVDDGEAEWCLEVIEELFDNYYAKPALVQSKKDALNLKLAAAGKPPAK